MEYVRDGVDAGRRGGGRGALFFLWVWCGVAPPYMYGRAGMDGKSVRAKTLNNTLNNYVL